MVTATRVEIISLFNCSLGKFQFRTGQTRPVKPLRKFIHNSQPLTIHFCPDLDIEFRISGDNFVPVIGGDGEVLDTEFDVAMKKFSGVYAEGARAIIGIVAHPQESVKFKAQVYAPRGELAKGVDLQTHRSGFLTGL
jgi:hypothetical protein